MCEAGVMAWWVSALAGQARRPEFKSAEPAWKAACDCVHAYKVSSVKRERLETGGSLGLVVLVSGLQGIKQTVMELGTECPPPAPSHMHRCTYRHPHVHPPLSFFLSLPLHPPPNTDVSLVSQGLTKTQTDETLTAAWCASVIGNVWHNWIQCFDGTIVLFSIGTHTFKQIPQHLAGGFCLWKRSILSCPSTSLSEPSQKCLSGWKLNKELWLLSGSWHIW